MGEDPVPGVERQPWSPYCHMRKFNNQDYLPGSLLCQNGISDLWWYFLPTASRGYLDRWYGSVTFRTSYMHVLIWEFILLKTYIARLSISSIKLGVKWPLPAGPVLSLHKHISLILFVQYLYIPQTLISCKLVQYSYILIFWSSPLGLPCYIIACIYEYIIGLMHAVRLVSW